MRKMTTGMSRRLLLLAFGGGAIGLAGAARAQVQGDGGSAADGEPMISAIGFSPDGRLVAAAGSNNVIAVWETATGNLIQTMAWPETQNAAAALAFTSENRMLVVGNAPQRRRSKGKALVSFEIESGSLADLGAAEPDWAGVICANPKAQVVATAGRGYDHSIRLWSSDGLALERVWPAHDSPVLALAMSPDGRLLLSGGSNGRGGRDPSVRLWDLTGRRLRKLDGHKQSVQAVAFSADGRRLVSVSDDSVRVWNAQSGAAVSAADLKTGDASVYETILSPDGTWFAQVLHKEDGKDATLAVRAVDTGKVLKQWTDPRQTVPQLAASPDGQLVVIGGDSGRFVAWEAKSKHGLLRHTFTLPPPREKQP